MINETERQSQWEEQPGEKNVLDGKNEPNPGPIIHHGRKNSLHRMEHEVLSLLVFQRAWVAKSSHLTNILRLLLSHLI